MAVETEIGRIETDIGRIRYMLGARHTPAWFDDAKVGIFVNWGLFSVPGWAPKSGPLPTLLRTHYQEANKLSPNAEWYWNGLRIEGSPTWRYHKDVWNERPYEDFRQPFAAAVEAWDPTVWAESFRAAGAHYVILSAKHHDGYLLWPSKFPNPKREGWQTSRDVVGELAAAVRKLGMRFGVYYSGGLDWTFDEGPIHGGLDVFAHVPESPLYGRYVVSHYRELIESYEPSVLWNDVAFPDVPELYPLLYFYISHVQEGAINDRFSPIAASLHWLRRSPVRVVANMIGRWRLDGDDGPLLVPESSEADFRTAQYTPFKTTQKVKWELTRSMGNSPAWNRAEADSDLIPADELVHLLIDTVAKNGNLLLDIGPTDTGALPEAQSARLAAMGRWLRINGEAIYGTHTWWSRAEGTTTDGLPIRFTGKPGHLFAILLGTPAKETLTIADMPRLHPAKVEVLGHGAVEARTDADGDLTVGWPAGLEKQPAYSIKIVLEDSPE